MPSLILIRWVIENHETLDDSAGEESADGDADLVAQDTEPANVVGDLFLGAARREFGDPVVLAARGRGPGIVNMRIFFIMWDWNWELTSTPSPPCSRLLA